MQIRNYFKLLIAILLVVSTIEPYYIHSVYADGNEPINPIAINIDESFEVFDAGMKTIHSKTYDDINFDFIAVNGTFSISGNGGEEDTQGLSLSDPISNDQQQEIIIKRSDSGEFYFSSLFVISFIENVTVNSYRNGVIVESKVLDPSEDDSVKLEFDSTVSVDEIRISSSDFLWIAIDTFKAKTYNKSISDLQGNSGDSQASFTFNKPENAKDIVLQQSDDNGQTWIDTSINLDGNSTTATIGNLANGTHYKFRLFVIGGTHAGYSNEVTITPLAITQSVPAQTPTVTSATTDEDNFNGNGLDISTMDNNVRYYKITDIKGGTLYHNDQTTPIQSDSFISKDQAGGGLKFKPDEDANDMDGVPFSFNVQAAYDETGMGLSEKVEATITVNPVNDLPVANDDTITPSINDETLVRTFNTNDLLENDTEGATNEGDQTISIDAESITNSSVVGGTVTLQGNNILFTPSPSTNGTASFTYTISDNGEAPNGSLSEATVSFPVKPKPEAPSVTRDDNANTVTGITPVMEYKLDNENWKQYQSDAFSQLNFSGSHTLLVRIYKNEETGTPTGNITTLTFTPDLPSSPENLTHSIINGNDIKLQWNSVPNATNYRIYQVSNGEKNLVKDVTTTSVVFQNMPADDYTYEISTVNNVGESPNAKSTSFTLVHPIMQKPGNLTNEIENENEVTLKWSAVPYADSYQIYQIIDGERVLKNSVVGTTKKYTSLPAGNYKYVIYSVSDRFGSSPEGYETEFNIILTSPNAPNVFADDVSNTIIGADNKMEYSINNGFSWTKYNSLLIPIFSDSQLVLVRVAADATTGRPAGATATLTFTQNIVQQPSTPPLTTIPTPTPSSPGTRQGDVEVGNGSTSGTVAKVDIVRKTEGNQKVDNVVLDNKTTEDVIKNAIEEKKENVSIMISDIPNDPTDQVYVNIEKLSLQHLSDSKVSLGIQTDDVNIQLPNGSIQALQNSDKDVYFRIVPIRKEEDKKKVYENTLNAEVVKEISGNKEVQVLGKPMTIETNYSNQKTLVTFSLKDITLPEDSSKRDDFLKSLAVFIQHSDGEKVVKKGNIKYDSTGNPLGIEIEITKFSTFTIIGVPNKAPEVSNLSVSGNTIVEEKVKGTYSYSDLDKDQEAKSTFRWYRADDAKGKNKKVIAGAINSSYTFTSADQGKFVGFEVTPVAKTGEIKGSSKISSFIGPIKSKTKPNSEPSVKNVKISGKTTVKSTLRASYVYEDKENDAQGISNMQWYRIDLKTKKKQKIMGATKSNYTLTNKDAGYYIAYEITPIAKTGKKVGKPVISSKTKIIKEAPIQYNGQLILGSIKSKSYVNSLGQTIKSKYKGKVEIKRKGTYYYLVAEFVDKKRAEEVGSEMKKKKLIVNYNVK